MFLNTFRQTLHLLKGNQNFLHPQEEEEEEEEEEADRQVKVDEEGLKVKSVKGKKKKRKRLNKKARRRDNCFSLCASCNDGVRLKGRPPLFAHVS
jgi:hypothetical protein